MILTPTLHTLHLGEILDFTEVKQADMEGEMEVMVKDWTRCALSLGAGGHAHTHALRRTHMCPHAHTRATSQVPLWRGEEEPGKQQTLTPRRGK